MDAWAVQKGRKHYEGGFRDGVVDGQGTQFCETSKHEQPYYTGGWKAGKPHGEGQAFFENGLTQYQGR